MYNTIKISVNARCLKPGTVWTLSVGKTVDPPSPPLALPPPSLPSCHLAFGLPPLLRLSAQLALLFGQSASQGQTQTQTQTFSSTLLISGFQF